MYRKRRRDSAKFNERLARARQTRLQNRLESPERDYPAELPELRRRIVIEDFDAGATVRHEFLLYRSNRVDCYKISVDGKPLPGRYGWARALELVRKAFVRVSMGVD